MNEPTAYLKKKVAEATLKYANKSKKWDTISLTSLARTLRIPVKRIQEIAPDRDSLLPLIFETLDEKTLRLLPSDYGNTPREKILEILLCQLDCMTPYKQAYRLIYQYVWTHKQIGLRLLPAYMRSLRSVVAHAITEPTATTSSPILIIGLAPIYACAIKCWLHEADTSHPKTMALLDRNLQRMECMLNTRNHKR